MAEKNYWDRIRKTRLSGISLYTGQETGYWGMVLQPKLNTGEPARLG